MNRFFAERLVEGGDQFEGRFYRIVHVEIFVIGEASEEIGFLFQRGHFVQITFCQGGVLLVVDRVVRDFPFFAGVRIFLGDDRRSVIGAFRVEMLMLADAGIGGIPIGVIDDRVPLVIVLGEFLGLETEGPPLKVAVFEGKEFVEAARVDDRVRARVVFIFFFKVIDVATDLDSFKQVFDEAAESAFDLALIRIVEIVVVIFKPKREALDDRGRKLLARTSPLLLRVSLDEFLEDGSPNELDRLLLEVTRLALDFLGFFLDMGLGFFGRLHAPKGFEGEHVERHGISFPMVIRLHAVHVGVGLAITVDELPNVIVGRMEDVRAIGVDDDAVHVFRRHVPSNIGTGFEDEDGFAFFMQQTRGGRSA